MSYAIHSAMRKLSAPELHGVLLRAILVRAISDLRFISERVFVPLCCRATYSGSLHLPRRTV